MSRRAGAVRVSGGVPERLRAALRAGWGLPDGTVVDLTWEQFGPGEVVVGGAVVSRSPGPPVRCREQYELLRARVAAALSG